MTADYAHLGAQSKQQKHRFSHMTKKHGHAMALRMALRTKEVEAAYDPDRIRAAMIQVMEEKNLRPRPWAESVGVSPGSLYSFLKIVDPDKRPSLAKERTRAPHISFFYYLAYAAGVPLTRLLGLDSSPTESRPAGPGQSAESASSDSEALRLYRSLMQAQEHLLKLEQRLSERDRRIEELEHQASRRPGSPPTR